MAVDLWVGFSLFMSNCLYLYLSILVCFYDGILYLINLGIYICYFFFESVNVVFEGIDISLYFMEPVVLNVNYNLYFVINRIPYVSLLVLLLQADLGQLFAHPLKQLFLKLLLHQFLGFRQLLLCYIAVPNCRFV
jgi:hypothetical protein